MSTARPGAPCLPHASPDTFDVNGDWEGPAERMPRGNGGRLSSSQSGTTKPSAPRVRCAGIGNLCVRQRPEPDAQPAAGRGQRRILVCR